MIKQMEPNQQSSPVRTAAHSGFSKKLAKLIRVVSVPPVMVGTLIILLTVNRPDVITSWGQAALAALFLTVIPVLAYPVAALIPSIRAKGREGQRNLAFVFSMVGYIGGVVYGLTAGVSESLMVIFGTYLLSVTILTIFNKLIRIRASGHGCSVAGPIALICYFLDPWFIPVSLVVYAAIFWASVHMGRHTVKEFILGSLSSPVALGIVSSLAIIF